MNFFSIIVIVNPCESLQTDYEQNVSYAFEAETTFIDL